MRVVADGAVILDVDHQAGAATDRENETDVALLDDLDGLQARLARWVRFDAGELDELMFFQRADDLVIDAVAFDRAAAITKQHRHLRRHAVGDFRAGGTARAHHCGRGA